MLRQFTGPPPVSSVSPADSRRNVLCSPVRGHHSTAARVAAESAMSLGPILIILLVIILLGGFSGRIRRLRLWARPFRDGSVRGHFDRGAGPGPAWQAVIHLTI